MLERIPRIIREIQKMQQVEANSNGNQEQEQKKQEQASTYLLLFAASCFPILITSLSNFLHQLAELTRCIEISDRHVLIHLTAGEFHHVVFWSDR